MAIIPVDASPLRPPYPGPDTPGLHLTWSAELADRLGAGLPLTVLGQVALEPPLGRLLVMGRSEPGTPGTPGVAALAAVIMPQGNAGALALAPFGLGPLAGTLQPPDELRDRFRIRRTAE